MLLLIDNYDSFTFNLVHFLGELGAPVSVWRNDKISVPDASLRLVQACGRLIRHETDGGRITLLDRRIVTRRYGQALLDSLPPYRLEVAKQRAHRRTSRCPSVPGGARMPCVSGRERPGRLPRACRAAR